MKETEDMDMDFMRGMVMDVNEMVVEPEQQLSDEIYHYDRGTHTLSLVKPMQHEEEICAALNEGMSQEMM